MPLRILPQPVNRILIKDPIACLMSEYLTNHFALQTLVLFRHPAGFVASIKRLKWPRAPLIKQFLACKPLMTDWLSPYRKIMESVQNHENIETAAVLHGCLYTVLWGYVCRNKNMTAICYEDLCILPIEKFEKLFQKLNLPYDNDVRRNHKILCYTKDENHDDNNPHAVHRNSKKAATRWRQDLVPDEINRIQHIWEHFNLPLYRKDEDWGLS